MLQSKYKNTRIILASQSPRRQELLKGLDLDFIIETRPVNEIYDPNLKRSQITDYLSQLKAKAFNELKPKDLLITSDTIVWVNEVALGKPKNEKEATEMLASLSGKMHSVYTSVCFTTDNNQWVINDETKVYFKDLTGEEIEYYVSTYSPFDRAGSYGIQDWLGYSRIEKIEGCYYNVMGLPLPKVYSFLKNVEL
jgi:septum formation protein